jgi:hypothetical protein
MTSDRAPGALRRLRSSALAFAAYAAFTIAATWPLSGSPGRLGTLLDDTYSHVWGLAWVVRQAVRDPLHLFDSNMYWPHLQSLAYGESLLAQALQAAPVRLFGGSPFLAHNVVLLLTFPLAGLGAYLLARQVTRHSLTAFVAGLVYAFSAHRWNHLVHIGIVSTQWFPFVVLCFVRAVRRPGARTLLPLAAFVTLQGLSSGYYTVLVTIVVALSCAWFAPAVVRRGRWAAWVASLGGAFAILVVAGLPYRAMAAREGLEVVRPREVCLHYSAQVSSYVMPGATMGRRLPHMRWLETHFHSGEQQFAGLVALALALVGAVAGGRRRRFVLFLALSGFILSLGPEIRLGSLRLPGPFDLLRHLPPVNMIRDPSRLGVLAMLGQAILAAAGLRAVGMALPRCRTPITLGLVSLVALEVFPSGLSGLFREIPPYRPTSQWLASAPRGPLLVLPWDADTPFSGSYLFDATVHWQPMVNGHGAFAAAGTFELGVLGKRFPHANVVAALRAVGIRYVVVHEDLLTDDRRQLLDAAPLPEGVDRVGEAGFGPSRIYAIDPEGPRAAPAWLARTLGLAPSLVRPRPQ